MPLIHEKAERFGLSIVQGQATGRIEGADWLTESEIEWKVQDQFRSPSADACLPTSNDLVPKSLFFKFALSLVEVFDRRMVSTTSLHDQDASGLVRI